MLHQTKGIIIRTVKYGETSLIVSAFTELFGTQQYIVNGIRSSKKSHDISAAHLQIGNILEMTVYHNDRDTLQRIKECKQAVHYDGIFVDVTKNTVMLFMVEVLQKCLNEPDPHPELFYFIEDILKGLDQSNSFQTANLPLFFMLHLSHFFGFRMMDNFDEVRNILDLREGKFVENMPIHQQVITYPYSAYVSQFLKALQFNDLDQIKLNRQMRFDLINYCIDYYGLHIQPFGIMKTLPIIRTILE